MPNSARLSPSVPPLVKTISAARQFSNAANLLASMLHGGARLLPLLMNRRRVAELLAEVRTHRLEHLGQKRSGRVIVEVHPSHGFPILAV